MTTNPDGSWTTSTSVQPDPYTSFTSTWTTTDANGNPVTESGVVVVTTDSSGALTTSTSEFPYEGPT